MTQWQTIDSAPMDGSRLRLGNDKDTSSMKPTSLCPTFGSHNGKHWVVSSYFVVPGGRHGLMTNEPTHWMPTAPTSEVAP